MAMAQLFFLDIKRNRFSLYILNLNKEYETEPIYFIVPFVTILFMTYFISLPIFGKLSFLCY